MNSFIKGIFRYDTPKYVTIKDNSLIIGILFRLIQLLIIGYIIGYVIIWKKGYQLTDEIESAVTTKVKGVLYTNYNESDFVDGIKDYDLYNRIWDVSDFVVPPMEENGAFFVTTNLLITKNQTKGECAEDPKVKEALCFNDSDCEPMKPFLTGNGVATGRCIDSSVPGKKTCEIKAWCPVERDEGPLKYKKALLENSQNFTVLIKNFVEFPMFNVRRRSIINGKSLEGCIYNPVDNKLCPIFRLGDIVDNLLEKSSNDTYEKLASKGGVIAVEIEWDCNLDLNIEKCVPVYTFRRLDDSDAKIAPGWNFRYSHYYDDDERTLFKATGILFVVLVKGKAAKFHVVPLLMNIGAGVGLLAVASVICDIVALYIVKERKVYRSSKYEVVEPEDSQINRGNSNKLLGTEEQRLESIRSDIC